MPHAIAKDKVRIYYDSTGTGTPIVFAHEFWGDHRNWELQVRHFSRTHRCITFAARGYPPSDVPSEIEPYSQDNATDDIEAVLDHAGESKAHVVGLSMGGYATLHFGFRHPTRALSLCVGGCGYGSEIGAGDKYKLEAEDIARDIETRGMAAFADDYAKGATRIQYERKDPVGFAQFKQRLVKHSVEGSVNTQRGVQKRRPSLYDLLPEMKALTVPTMIVCGDEDWPCLTPSLMMKRRIASAALCVIPDSGHSVNQEEPALYNRMLEEFFAKVEAGRWSARDRKTMDWLEPAA